MNSTTQPSGRQRGHLHRYAVLSATFVAERLVPFSALFVPAVLLDEPETIGRLEILLTAGALAAMLGPLGTASAIMHSDFSGRRSNWLFAVRIAVVGGVLIGGVLSIGLGWQGAVVGALLGSAVAVYRVSLHRMRVSADTRPMVVSAVVVVVAFATLLTVAYLIGVRLDFGSALALAAASLIAVVPVLRITRFPEPDAPSQPSQMIRFGLPLAVSAGALWIVAAADRYGLALFDDLATVGRYGVMYRIVGIVSGLLSTVGLWWQVETMRRGAAWGESFKGRYLRGIVPGSIVVALAAVWPCTVVATRVLDLESREVFPIVAWLMVSVVLFAIANTFLALLAARAETRAVARVWIVAAIVNVGLNLVLIPVWSMIGAAVATVASMAVATASAAVLHRRLRSEAVL